MTKFVTTLVTVILVLVALAAIGPRIAPILEASVSVILVTAVSAAILRVLWFYTR